MSFYRIPDFVPTNVHARMPGKVRITGWEKRVHDFRSEEPEAWLERTGLTIHQARDLCKADLYFLAKEVLGYTFFYAPLHRPLAQEYQKYHPLSMWLVPRDHLKTTLFTIAGSVQEVLIDPNVTMLIASSKMENTRTILEDIRRKFVDNKRLRFLFPEYAMEEKDMPRWNEWNVVARNSMESKEFTFTAAATDSSVVSKHFDVIKCDDMVDDSNVRTSEGMEKVKAFFRRLWPLLRPGTGRLVVVGTRWDQDDAYNTIEQKMAGQGSMILKMAAEVKDEKGRTFALFPETDFGQPMYTLDVLRQRRRAMGDYEYFCNTGEAPILMADWTTKPVRDVQPGEWVMGFEFEDGERQRLVPAQVLRCKNRVTDVQKVHLDTGETIRCTPDHKWFTGRKNEKNRTRKSYAPVRVGSKMMGVYRPIPTPRTPQDWRDWGWLAGMIDGEGAVSRGYVALYQSPRVNPSVCSEIDAVLARLGIPYRKETFAPTDTSYSTSPTIQWRLLGGRSLRIAIQNYGRSPKIAAKADRLPRGTIAQRKPRVVGIEPDGRDRVYSMETTTGNYVAWSFASKNCQFMNSPRPDRENRLTTQEQIQWVSEIPKGVYNFVFCDPAISTREEADRFAIVCVAVDWKNNIYVRDCIADRMSISSAAQWIYEFAFTYKPMMTMMESLVFQEAYRQHIQTLIRINGGDVTITEAPRKSGEEKVRRIFGLQPYFHEGRIFFLKGGRGVQNVVDECLLYSKKMSKRQHDDIVDALSDAPLHSWAPPRPGHVLSDWSVGDHFAHQDLEEAGTAFSAMNFVTPAA